MAYLQHSSLGASLSPAEFRRLALVNFVIFHRQSGKSDAEIEAKLMVQSGLSLSHPCADPNRSNLCSVEEVRAVMAESSGIAVQRETAAKRKKQGLAVKGIVTNRNLIIAAGVAGALYLFSRR